ncbi:MAG: CusA/CzcA family heavy metal efflux RND transporter [Steroidobacteraceae bacterium]
MALILAAGAPSAKEVSREIEIRSRIAAANLEDAIVVDCQLPGSLQKLGGQRTYLTPGRLLRLAAVDCRSRGGEYTLGDLSSGTLSLDRWLPLAEKGDAEAQYYIARIYANGMSGVPTDYPRAVTWYRQAAQQNYSSAVQELGYMYERGLGVERDTMQALNLQRKAAGLGAELDYAWKITEAQADAARQVAALTDQLEASNALSETLRVEVATTTDALFKSRAELSRSENAVLDLQEQLKVSSESATMFRPMASTVIIALLGALALSLTFVPAAVAVVLRGEIKEKESIIVRGARRAYAPLLEWGMRLRSVILVSSLVFVVACAWLATRMGSEFIPSLDEGDLAVQALRIPGTSLTQSVEMQLQLERALKTVPEVKTSFARIGTAEVATDPMPPNISDGFVMLKEHGDWPQPRRDKATVMEEIQERLEAVPGNAFEMSQPIQLRFNELISGVRSDLGIKVFGDDLNQLLETGTAIARVLNSIDGADGVKVEQVEGLPMLTVEPNRPALYRYGLNVTDVQDVLAAATGGEEAGQVFEGDRRFSLIVRLPEHLRGNLTQLSRLPVPLPDGGYVPLAEVATLMLAPGPNQISRENGKRRVVVTSNVRGRDLGGFVAEARQRIAEQVRLPSGYWLNYGGTFEQLESASQRLTLLVPVTLVMIFALLFMTFGSVRDAALVFSGVPLALTGGVLGLWLRDIPLSITAGVGFITLSGVAVLTGVMMVAAFRDQLDNGASVDDAVRDGAMLRLRPILMVALVAALGFLPMALNTSTGAEVQRPLATVVIGGILSSTLLTLLVLPGLYRIAYFGRTLSLRGEGGVRVG